MTDFDAELERIDAAIGLLEDERAAALVAKRAACAHEWEADILHYRAKWCPKCGAGDFSDACSRIEWPVEFAEWPYDVPPRNFCWRHKQAAALCLVSA